MSIQFVSNKTLFLQALEAQTAKALEICGEKGESYAKQLCPVDTGALRNSISHKVDTAEDACYIGTNMEYAPYIEMGTGIHYEGGRRTPWAYEDKKGNFHITRGSKAQPFLKPAVADHKKEYNEIIKTELKK